MNIQIKPRNLAAAPFICDPDPDEDWYAEQMRRETAMQRVRSSVLDTVSPSDPKIIKAFDQIPKSKEINLKVIQEVHRKTATPGSTVPEPERQYGGPVKAGELYKVGERGWEWFVPDKDGQIVPHQESVEILRELRSPVFVPGAQTATTYDQRRTHTDARQQTYNFPDARAMAFLQARERTAAQRAFAGASGM